MARNDFGWFGWVSLSGFLILGTLYLIDLAFVEVWPVSLAATLTVAIIAGLGALALYVGNDPTASTRSRDRDERTRTE